MNRAQKEIAMRKIAFVISITIVVVFWGGADSSSQSDQSDINKKLAQIDINKATIEDVIRVFGEPIKYTWGGKTFTKNDLPSTYLAVYPNDFYVCISAGRISELRHEGPDGYLFRGKLMVGSSLEEAITVLGKPTEIVEGQPIGFKDGVLYKDADGKKGHCYYGRKDQSVRIFFSDYKIAALYVTRSDFRGSGGSFKTVQPIKSVKEFDDVRWKDMSQSDINEKLAQIDIDKATLEDVIRIFGEPIKYTWGGKTFTKDTLPSTYAAAYPNNFDIVLSNGKIAQLRFRGPKAGYVYQGKLKAGSSLDEVLEVVGQPTETVEGQTMPKLAKDNVLYKNIGGKKGYCFYYYSRKDHGVQFYFLDYKLTDLTLTYPAAGRSRSFKTVQPIKSVKEFDDVRWKDMSKLNLSDKKDIIVTLTFNRKTVWPEPNKLPDRLDPNKLMTHTMNPGLGIRMLHKQGITGKGVNVAIIDQPVFLDHPEFKGKIVAYYDTGCNSQGSMHGPAVTSLLVGTNCGTAPDARVYYVAVPSWKRDTAYEARALDWIIEQNKKLPAGDKIRVVSVSAAPSGQGAPRDKNQYMWDHACARAEAQGILVLDCTPHRGLIGPCWYDIKNPESVVKCTPGFPGMPSMHQPGKILVPASPRTVAEEYDKGDCGYQYCGRGGLSWAIPYAAGVLALGWQIRSDLTGEQMRDMLFRSAYTNSRGDKVIDPVKFIQLVKKAKAPPKSPTTNAF